MALRDTYVRVDREYEGNNVVRMLYFDAAGAPVACNAGYDELRQAFDEQNRVVRQEFWLGGAPVLNNQQVAALERFYDEKGLIASESYFGTEGELVRCRAGYHRINRVWQERNLATFEAWFDENDQPMNIGNESYCAMERASDGRGLAVELKFYDGAGEPVACKDGYERVQRTYNEEKKVTLEVYLDNAGAPMANVKGVYQKRNSYDEKGNLILQEYLDAEGQPAPDADGHLRLVISYDENGKKSGETYEDAAPEEAGEAK